MPKRFVQISAVLTPAGVALYALDEEGNIFEKLVGVQNSTWIRIP